MSHCYGMLLCVFKFLGLFQFFHSEKNKEEPHNMSIPKLFQDRKIKMIPPFNLQCKRATSQRNDRKVLCSWHCKQLEAHEGTVEICFYNGGIVLFKCPFFFFSFLIINFLIINWFCSCLLLQLLWQSGFSVLTSFLCEPLNHGTISCYAWHSGGKNQSNLEGKPDVNRYRISRKWVFICE